MDIPLRDISRDPTEIVFSLKHTVVVYTIQNDVSVTHPTYYGLTIKNNSLRSTPTLFMKLTKKKTHSL